MAKNVFVKCKECGYTWYCSKLEWDAYTDAHNPPCPNMECSCHKGEPNWIAGNIVLPLWACALGSNDTKFKLDFNVYK